MDVVVSTHTLRSRSPSPTQPMNGDGPHVASSALQINCDDGEYDFIVDEQVATRTARVTPIEAHYHHEGDYITNAMHACVSIIICPGPFRGNKRVPAPIARPGDPSTIPEVPLLPTHRAEAEGAGGIRQNLRGCTGGGREE